MRPPDYLTLWAGSERALVGAPAWLLVDWCEFYVAGIEDRTGWFRIPAWGMRRVDGDLPLYRAVAIRYGYRHVGANNKIFRAARAFLKLCADKDLLAEGETGGSLWLPSPNA
jgi:hypothetical protein